MSWPRSSAVLVVMLSAACVPNERPGGEGGAAPAAASSAAASRPTAARPTSRLRRKPAKVTEKPAARRPADPELTSPFVDDFERSNLGPDWLATSSAWRIQDGRLCVRNARNHPAWLKRRLPVNARIEFEAESRSSDGDIKAEFWGDGQSAAEGVSYEKATSYITIFGGWRNRYHVLARINEHAPDRPEIVVDGESSDIRAQPVEPDRTYHFKVERNDGKTVRWFVDDIELLTHTDPQPLAGAGHEHFAFNNWQVPVCFDNLKITPLP